MNEREIDTDTITNLHAYQHLQTHNRANKYTCKHLTLPQLQLQHFPLFMCVLYTIHYIGLYCRCVVVSGKSNISRLLLSLPFTLLVFYAFVCIRRHRRCRILFSLLSAGRFPFHIHLLIVLIFSSPCSPSSTIALKRFSDFRHLMKYIEYTG